MYNKISIYFFRKSVSKNLIMIDATFGLAAFVTQSECSINIRAKCSYLFGLSQKSLVAYSKFVFPAYKYCCIIVEKKSIISKKLCIKKAKDEKFIFDFTNISSY